MNIFELIPCNSQKSFYGKAQVIEFNGYAVLKSYDTEVCAYNKLDGRFVRLWDDWSATTGKHITAFCAYYGIHYEGKKTWDKMPVQKKADVVFNPADRERIANELKKKIAEILNEGACVSSIVSAVEFSDIA